MATTAPSEHKRVPLTQFHNATGNFLDQAMREPIVLTSHGRPRQIVADHAYVARLEEIARGRIIEALGIEAHPTAEMPKALRARVLANRPSAEEMAAGTTKTELPRRGRVWGGFPMVCFRIEKLESRRSGLGRGWAVSRLRDFS